MGLIKCTECGKEISDKATTCPNCGCPVNSTAGATPPPMQQAMPNMQTQAPVKRKKGHGCLITILVFIGIIVFFAIIGSVVSKNGTSDANSNDAQQQVEATETSEASGTSIVFGEEGEIAKEVMLKVNEVTETDSISAANGMMSYTPDSGKYAVVNVTISNNSKKSQNLLLNYFKLVGPDEAEYVATIVAIADDKFITVDTINPNLDITGNLLFEIPKELSAQDCKLKYSDYDLFSNISYFELK